MPLPLLKKQFKFCYLSAVLSTVLSVRSPDGIGTKAEALAKVESLLKADVILHFNSLVLDFQF